MGFNPAKFITDAGDFVEDAGDFIEENPLETAVVVGAVGAAPFTGGASLLAIPAGASIQSQIKSQQLAEEQASESKKQATIRNAVAGLRGQRQRSETLRRARIARGQVEAQGSVSGTQTSSAVVGGVSGITSTTAGNIGFSQAASDAGQKLFESGQKIFNLEKKKGRQDLVTGVSNQLFNIGVSAKRGDFSS